MPPFTSALQTSVPFPPPIEVVPAVPLPEYAPLPNPWTVRSLIPERVTPPGPYRAISEHPELLPQSRGGLRQALSEYDRRLGLGPSGPVVSAARRAGMSGTARGNARFEILVDRSGTIQSVSLLDASQDVHEWRRFAQSLQAMPLQGMRLGEDAQGVWMLLDVSANNERSSGHRRYWDYGLTFLFDVADISARTMRVVHATVASEVAF